MSDVVAVSTELFLARCSSCFKNPFSVKEEDLNSGPQDHSLIFKATQVTWYKLNEFSNLVEQKIWQTSRKVMSASIQMPASLELYR